jgi:branched-chain amino acid transport system substrate-binding protein
MFTLAEKERRHEAIRRLIDALNLNALIGAPIPITGNIAMNGAEEKWAFEQAIKDANAKGGIFIKQFNKKLPIRFVVEDAESDPGKAVAATERRVIQLLETNIL